MFYNKSVYHLIKDHIGSTRGVIERETGDLVESKDYYPFGKILKEEVSDVTKAVEGYSGKELD